MEFKVDTFTTHTIEVIDSDGTTWEIRVDNGRVTEVYNKRVGYKGFSPPSVSEVFRLALGHRKEFNELLDKIGEL